MRFLVIVCSVTALPNMVWAGAWSQKPGHLFIKLSYFSLTSDRRYSTGGGLESSCLLEQSPGCFLRPLASGVEIPVFDDLPGSAKSRAVFLSTELGLFAGLELSAQLGYFVSENDFDTGVPQSIITEASGFSDLRTNLKYQYLTAGGLAAAVSAGVKAPTGEFNPNAFGVSLGEGGWDYEIAHEAGWSFWPLPIYTNVRLGYRWRTTNEAEIDFGDEFIYNVEAGVNLGSHLLFKIAFHGLNAAEDIQKLGFGRPDTPGRKINFLAPSLFWTITNYTLEAGIERSLSGRNYISGTKINLGLSRNIKLF